MNTPAPAALKLVKMLESCIHDRGFDALDAETRRQLAAIIDEHTGQWRPIAEWVRKGVTSPNAGFPTFLGDRVMIAYEADGEKYVSGGSFYSTEYEPNGPLVGWYSDYGDKVVPTHFMEIPAPPQQ